YHLDRHLYLLVNDRGSISVEITTAEHDFEQVLAGSLRVRVPAARHQFGNGFEVLAATLLNITLVDPLAAQPGSRPLPFADQVDDGAIGSGPTMDRVEVSRSRRL